MKPLALTGLLSLLGLLPAHAQNLNAHLRTNIVHVQQGWLKGFQPKGSKLHQFFGVPFAQPPVGPLRWKDPQPPTSLSGIREALHFGPKAMQKPVFSDMVFRTQQTSEDCLYLNVWTPANSSEAKLPVLVYFYGGGYIAGDGSEGRYDGAALARQGIVVVTVNYRLGVFGFLALPALSQESPHHSSGNYGLLDQQAALAWVHRNIAAFGGDPSRITIGGESAGSISVSAQMASPLSRHLIAGAIGESGAMIRPTFPAISLKQAEQQGETFLEKAGITSLAELRGLSADSVLDLASRRGMPIFSPAIDGYFLPESPERIFEEGKQAQVPLLVGWNSAEVPYMALMMGQTLTPEHYQAVLHKLYGNRATEALNAFKDQPTSVLVNSATQLASDRFIVYSTWKWSELQRLHSSQPVYRYLFAKARPPMVQATSQSSPWDPAPMKGAAHASEIEYALGNLGYNHVYAWTTNDHKVSRLMNTYFANFIKTGNPNGSGLPHWTANRSGEPLSYMYLNTISQLKQESPEQAAQFQFLDSWYQQSDH